MFQTFPCLIVWCCFNIAAVVMVLCQISFCEVTVPKLLLHVNKCTQDQQWWDQPTFTLKPPHWCCPSVSPRELITAQNNSTGFPSANVWMSLTIGVSISFWPYFDTSSALTIASRRIDKLVDALDLCYPKYNSTNQFCVFQHGFLMGCTILLHRDKGLFAMP